MRITKVLNNNAVVVIDENQEKIAIGPGVGYNQRKHDVVPPAKIEKLFILKENEKLQELLLRIPEEHFILAEEIIEYAEDYLDIKLSEHVRIGLTDHLSFAIEREEQGIHLKNKLLPEIKTLYKDEFEIGRWALRHINEKLNIEMPIDEASFIALHIHTMKIQGGDLHETVKQTTIIRDMVEVIQKHLAISMEKDSISYERLITHLRFALTRSQHYQAHTLDAEMLQMIQHKFATSYACALVLAEHLSNHYDLHLPEEELGYITLHIERLRKY